MILVLLGIAVLLLLIGIVWYKNDEYSIGALFVGILGGISVAAAMTITIILTYAVSEAKVIDSKIEMYQMANEKIETQIAETVQQYQEYEQGVFEKVAPEKAVTLVALYPELKSNELVSKQISVYVDNNQKINELKEKKINASIDKWWLYFGRDTKKGGAE